MAELLRIGYGKQAVSVYRTDGVSSLFAAEIGMTARGEAFGLVHGGRQHARRRHGTP